VTERLDADDLRTQKKYFKGYYSRQAQAIYTLQMREAIMRRTQEGYTDEQIAQELGQTEATIRRYRKAAMAHPRALPPPDEPGTSDEPRRKIPPKGPGPGPHRPGSRKSPMEILPPADVDKYRAVCLAMRKQAIPFDEMARTLGITEKEARRYTADALRGLSDSETTHAELERRLMVEQIDAMIRSAYVMATRTEDLPPNLDAQDRIIKLLDRKAKLLGLDQVPAQDIRVKLQQLSQEGNYDLEELEDIARVVLARHRFQIVSPTDETSPGSEVS